MIFMDFSDYEKDIFKLVRYNHFYTTAFHAKGFDFKVYVKIVDDGVITEPADGFPAIIAKPWDGHDVMISYCFSSVKLHNRTIEENLVHNVSKFGIKKIEIIETKDWVYFPHVGMDALRDGFYEKLEALQGKNNTYYTGGLLNFELVENVMAYSRDLVKRFF